MRTYAIFRRASTSLAASAPRPWLRWSTRAGLPLILMACGVEGPGAVITSVAVDAVKVVPVTGRIMGAVMQDSLLLVGEAFSNAVVRADASGRILDSISAQGDGPGEWRSIGWLCPYRGDSVAVLDGRGRRTIVLTRHGVPVRTQTWESRVPLALARCGSAQSPEAFESLPGDSGRIFTTAAQGPTGRPLAVALRGPRMLAARRASESAGRQSVTRLSLPAPFALEDHAVVLDQRLLVARVGQRGLTLESIDADSTVDTLAVVHGEPPRLAAAELAEVSLPPPVAETYRPPTHKPMIANRGLAAGDGRVAVLLSRPHAASADRILVIDARTGMACLIQLDARVRLQAITGTRLLVSTSDPDGLESILELRFDSSTDRRGCLRLDRARSVVLERQ